MKNIRHKPHPQLIVGKSVLVYVCREMGKCRTVTNSNTREYRQ